MTAAQEIAEDQLVANIVLELYDEHDEVCDCWRPESHVAGALREAGFELVKAPEPGRADATEAGQ